MSLTTTEEILEASEHLPEGAMLTVPSVSWDEYERLLSEFEERSRLRVSYDCGNLEIVSPHSEHEAYARFLDALVRAFADSRDMELEARGHTTWKRKALDKGVEADACYYVRNAERIIGKRNIDLESAPPPDIVVEIDTTRQSLRKFPLYAALAVPEIWRYDGQNVYFYELVESHYIEVDESRMLPGLSGPAISNCIDVSKTHGQRTALRMFREQMERNGRGRAGV